ncbi:85_t:CDS:2 [Paraglomus occultum]|uniref:85_t:CDS:1 n=1 Tax=Paraglomus occultum TaxID=144539 RepID=A0A9N8WJ75_9GLOM|nr:85_t:CDS:2 [Paraglomus occultum]
MWILYRYTANHITNLVGNLLSRNLPSFISAFELEYHKVDLVRVVTLEAAHVADPYGQCHDPVLEVVLTLLTLQGAAPTLVVRLTREVVLVHVRLIPLNATVAHLNEIFGAYGHINGIDMPTNKKWSVNRGIAYIEYETRSEAEKAISYMDGGQLDGAVLSCAFVPRRPSPPPPSIRRRGRGRVDVTYLPGGSLEAVIEHEAGRHCDDILDLDLDRLYTEDVRILIVHTVPEVDLEHHILEVVVGQGLPQK